MTENRKKKMAKKMLKHDRRMKRLDPNDSDVLKQFSRYDKENNRPLFTMPEGTYKPVGKRYIKQKDSNKGVILE